MGSDDEGGGVLTRDEVDALCALSEDPERCHWGSWASLPKGVESANGATSPPSCFLEESFPEAVSQSPLLFPGGVVHWKTFPGKTTGTMESR